MPGKVKKNTKQQTKEEWDEVLTLSRLLQYLG